MVSVTGEAAGIVDLIVGPRLLFLVIVYGFCPYSVLWVAVRIWPKDHPRRQELLGEFEHVAVWYRPIWVAEMVARALLDGTSARLRHRRSVMRGRTMRIPRSVKFAGAGALVLTVAVAVPAFASEGVGSLAGWLTISVFLVLLVQIPLMVALEGPLARLAARFGGRRTRHPLLRASAEPRDDFEQPPG